MNALCRAEAIVGCKHTIHSLCRPTGSCRTAFNSLSSYHNHQNSKVPTHTRDRPIWQTASAKSGTGSPGARWIMIPGNSQPPAAIIVHTTRRQMLMSVITSTVARYRIDPGRIILD